MTAVILDAHPKINIDNSDNAALTQGLVEMLVVEDASGLYRCEAVFGNLGEVNGGIAYPLLDRQVLDFGKSLKVKFGANDVVFDGRIMGLEASFPLAPALPTLTVLAEDRFQDLRMTRRTRTFSDITDRDVIEQIAGDHSLQTNLRISSQSHIVLAQVNQSDLAFLREIGRAIDAEVWVEGNTLFAQSRRERNGSRIVSLRYEATLHEFTVTADLAQQRTSVTVSGWDTSAKSSIKHEATGQILQNELNGDESGVSILEAKIGARKEALAHTVPLSSQEAQSEAEAYLKMNARRFLVATGSTDGDARLHVGTVIDVSNVGSLFNGKYTLTEVRHTFDGSGLRTEFTAERPGLGPAR